MIRGFEPVRKDFRKNDSDTILPLRKTIASAGYDFFIPGDAGITLYVGDKEIIWTDVKAKMKEDEVLIIQVRSSLGIKHGLKIANGFGVIDADYYSNPSNDGNIGICLVNSGDRPITLKPGEGIAQGIFFNYLTAENCNSEEERVGGIGSTN